MYQYIKLKLPKKVSTNKIYAGVHWALRNKDKELFLKSLLPIKGKIVPVNVCELSFDFKFKSKPLDCSNCSYMAKLIEDSLRYYGIIKDDNCNIVKRITISSSKGNEDGVDIIIDNLNTYSEILC